MNLERNIHYQQDNSERSERELQNPKAFKRFCQITTNFYSDLKNGATNYVSAGIETIRKNFAKSCNDVTDLINNPKLEEQIEEIKENLDIDTTQTNYLKQFQDYAGTIHETLKRGHDTTVENIRIEHRKFIDKVEENNLQYYIAAGAFVSLAALPAASLIPCLALLGVITGVSVAAKNIVTTMLDEDQQKYKGAINFAHDATKFLAYLVVKGKCTALFMGYVSMFVPFSPVTCGIVATFLGLTMARIAINAVTYGQKMLLPRDVRHYLFDTPLKVHEKALKSKQDYLANASLSDSQIESLNQEIEGLKGKITKLEELEIKIKQCKEELTHDKDNKALANKLKTLEKKERKYIDNPFMKSIAGNIIPDFLQSLIFGTLPGIVLPNALDSLVGSVLGTSAVVDLSSYVSAVKVGVMNNVLNPIKGIISAHSPSQDKELNKGLGILSISNIRKFLDNNIFGKVTTFCQQFSDRGERQGANSIKVEVGNNLVNTFDTGLRLQELKGENKPIEQTK